MKDSRRQFLKTSGQLALGMGLLGIHACTSEPTDSVSGAQEQNKTKNQESSSLFFGISLAQWSLHQALGIRGGEPTLDNLDFAACAKNDFGISAIEYVNQFFKDKAKDKAYLQQLNQRAKDNGVEQLLIMVDGEGDLAHTDNKKRKEAVANHFKWVDAAKFLGCHSIRVNAATNSENPIEAAMAAVDGLGTLSVYAKNVGLNVIVENHGGFSSDASWLVNVMKKLNMENCGTLPDFGNFCIKTDGENIWDGNCIQEYDRYQGVLELMPYAKAVSAKTHDFDKEGNETNTDYFKMLKIVKEAGYSGYIGIEYEGSALTEPEGIRATKKLMEKAGRALS